MFVQSISLENTDKLKVAHFAPLFGQIGQINRQNEQAVFFNPAIHKCSCLVCNMKPEWDAHI